MKEILLNTGNKTIVDDEDFINLIKYGWYEINGKDTTYAITNINNKIAYMHRIILKTNKQVDHKDGNGLNNQKENLREATNAQNSRNKIGSRSKKYSKFKGVTYRKDPRHHNKPWTAALMFNYKQIHIGSFKTEEEAAKAYDEKAITLFGEFAKTNNMMKLYTVASN